MRLNIDRLIGGHRTATISLARDMEITVLDDVVDAETGFPVEVSARGLKGLSLWDVSQALHERYAGDTAFVVRSHSGFAIVRPAFSETPVFYWLRGNQLEVWSGLRPPAFDLDYLAGSIVNLAWMTPATGLQGISEVLSGATLIFDGSSLRQVDMLADMVRGLIPQGRKTAYAAEVSRFRGLIDNAVRHKTGAYPQQFSVLCSGGLDSSVLTVAAATRHPGTTLPLIHCYSAEDPDGDERFYFREVADRVGGSSTFVETNSRLSRTDLSPHLLGPSLRPINLATTVGTYSLLFEAAAANGSRAVVTGDGGDQLFLLDRPGIYSREVLAEASGPMAALRAMASIAIRDRSTLWQIADEVVRAKRVGEWRCDLFGAGRFKANALCPVAVPADRDVVPNGSRLSQLGFSRAFQFFGMRSAELNRIVLSGSDVAHRKPFLFWPLIKAAMRARRTHHMAGGRDRAIERDAFKAELPGAIYHRVSKGAGRDLLDRYDYQAIADSLVGSLPCQFKIVCKDQISNLANSRIDYESAQALVKARGIADWMGFYGQGGAVSSSNTA